MKHMNRLTSLTALAFFTLPLTSNADEDKITREQLPQAVVKAVESKFPQGKLKEATKETEEGKTTYEVDLQVDDQNIEVTLGEDGMIQEIEKEIPVSGLPKAVSDAVKAKYANAAFKEAEEVIKGEATSFEILISSEGVMREFKLAVDGKILEDKVEDD